MTLWADVLQELTGLLWLRDHGRIAGTVDVQMATPYACSTREGSHEAAMARGAGKTVRKP